MQWQIQEELERGITQHKRYMARNVFYTIVYEVMSLFTAYRIARL